MRRDQHSPVRALDAILGLDIGEPVTAPRELMPPDVEAEIVQSAGERVDHEHVVGGRGVAAAHLQHLAVDERVDARDAGDVAAEGRRGDARAHRVDRFRGRDAGREPGNEPLGVRLTRAGEQRRIGQQSLGVPVPSARDVQLLDRGAGHGSDVHAARGRTERGDRRRQPGGELTGNERVRGRGAHARLRLCPVLDRVAREGRGGRDRPVVAQEEGRGLLHPVPKISREAALLECVHTPRRRHGEDEAVGGDVHRNDLVGVRDRRELAQAPACRHVDPDPEDGAGLDGRECEDRVGRGAHPRRAGQHAFVGILAHEHTVVGWHARARHRVVEDRAGDLRTPMDERIVGEMPANAAPSAATARTRAASPAPGFEMMPSRSPANASRTSTTRGRGRKVNEPSAATRTSASVAPTSKNGVAISILSILRKSNGRLV